MMQSHLNLSPPTFYRPFPTPEDQQPYYVQTKPYLILIIMNTSDNIINLSSTNSSPISQSFMADMLSGILVTNKISKNT